MMLFVIEAFSVELHIVTKIELFFSWPRNPESVLYSSSGWTVKKTDQLLASARPSNLNSRFPRHNNSGATAIQSTWVFSPEDEIKPDQDGRYRPEVYEKKEGSAFSGVGSTLAIDSSGKRLIPSVSKLSCRSSSRYTILDCFRQSR
jgi:hypothetical protein